MFDNYITKNGAEKLKAELDNLTYEKLPSVLQALSTARSFGDFSENAEYLYAKKNLAEINKRTTKIRHILEKARIVEPRSKNDVCDIVQFGVIVTIMDLSDNVIQEYTMVGDAEADITCNLLSVDSLLGKNLLGGKKDEIIELEVPSGYKRYKILEIKW